MEKSVIIFAVSIAYDGDCLFHVSISRPDVKADAYFYGNANTFKEFGKGLMLFPKDSTDIVEFQAGQNSHPAQCFLLLRAYYDSRHGHIALKITADNNQEMALHNRFEFSIAAEAASINELGRMLVGWHVEDVPQIIWKAETP
ncbi:hypothetical protein Q5H92_11685 [Hymenobacter sp. M29]|uniref:DUF4265 domain-containing protein n=1 Tax=Hymenobacter mellowenesis TaxID=3063995 RepID=A0ABT9AC88_9BACT|nr:hypothetical protein [Hymenobacter sp. M29]MDO7847022.1 hypothetical protein [Hymenobacter sp. M29]